MASRLSEESLKGVYDTGHQGLAIQNDRALDLLNGPAVDLDRLLLAEEPEIAIQAVPPQSLYHALMHKGLEDSLDVLEHVSAEQVARIFDYDCWSEDRLAPLKAVRWLNLFKEISPEQLYQRFKGLDEEYQLALLGPILEIFDEDEYEDLSQSEQDALHRMPCGTLFYKIKTSDTRIEEFVGNLLEATMGQDINYAYSLLAHAAYIPPNEQEAQMAQFRRARLEEDGFVTFEESLSIFRPLDLVDAKRKWQGLLRQGQPAETATLPVTVFKDQSDLFLLRVIELGTSRWNTETFEQVSRGFALLSNSLAAAAKVEPDDLQGLKRLLQQGQSMASLGLEYLADGDVGVGVEILAKETTQVLFRTGLALVLKVADATMAELERHNLPEADLMRRQLRADKRGVLLHTLEQSLLQVLGFERVELLKGLVNRFPVSPVKVASEGDGAQRMLFKPVGSLAALGRLATAVDGLAGTLYLASLAGAGASKESWRMDLDRQLLTGVARVLVGGQFQASPLTSAETKRLGALPREAIQALASDFFAGVEGTLREALAPGGAGWSISRVAQIEVGDPVLPVMNEFASQVLRLTAALGSVEAGDEPGLVRVLSRIVEVEDKAQTKQEGL